MAAGYFRARIKGLSPFDKVSLFCKSPFDAEPFMHSSKKWSGTLHGHRNVPFSQIYQTFDCLGEWYMWLTTFVYKLSEPVERVFWRELLALLLCLLEEHPQFLAIHQMLSLRSSPRFRLLRHQVFISWVGCDFSPATAFPFAGKYCLWGTTEGRAMGHVDTKL